MTPISLKPAAGALALAAVALLAACGSTKTETVTVTSTATRTVAANTTASSETATSSSSSTSTSSSSSSETSTSTTATSATATTPAATSTTRTETAPAFVGTTTTPSGALGAAVALLERKGYQALDTSTYDAGDTLRVLIGRSAGGERAFFFDQGTYLGTDASTASAQITVLGQNDTEVTLAYATFRAGESAPSGRRTVRFALDMGQLSPLEPIPSVTARR